MEEIKRYAWRCKRCYTISPESSSVCSKRQCSANLRIFGEMGELDEYGNWSLVTNDDLRMVEPPPVIIIDDHSEPKPPEPPIREKEPKPKKVQEPKPIKIEKPKIKKVKEPKPVKVKDSDSRGSKKGGLILLLIIMILALLAAVFGVIWYFADGFSKDEGNSSKKEKSGSTAEAPVDPEPEPEPEPDADPIYAPDFGKYLDDGAVLVSSKKKGDYRLYKYDVPTYYVEEAIDEYVDLLEDEYPFEFSDDYKTLVWFLYNGDSPITTLNSDVNGTEYHIEIILGDDDDGNTTVEFHYAKEIELEDPGVRFDIPDKPDPEVFYDVPDFLSFAKGYAAKTSQRDEPDYSTYSYTMLQASYPIVVEYESMLVDNYSFEFINEKVFETNNGRNIYYFYKYTQSGPTSTLKTTFTDGSIIDGYHIRMQISIETDSNVTVSISLIDGFQFQSHNHTTSFTGNPIPDFDYWTGRLPFDSSDGEYSNGLNYSVYGVYGSDVSLSEWKDIVTEFCNFIHAQYYFDAVYCADTTGSDGTIYHNWWFEYVGEGNVDEYSESLDDGSRVSFELCVFWYIDQDGDYIIEISYSDGLEIRIPFTASTNIS